MHLLHVVPSYFPAVRYGGPIRSVHGLAAAQARRGHTVEVFTTNVDGDGVLDVPTDAPVRLDGVAVSYFPVSGFRRLVVASAMMPALRRKMTQVDLVHLHSVYLWPTYAAARAAHNAQVPYLVAPRGMLVRELVERRNSTVKKLWIELVEKKTLRRSAGIHVTTATEDTDLRALNLACEKTYCVPNGVDVPESIEPFSNRDAIGHNPYVLFVGRLNWKKGIDKLIEAWRRIPDGISLVIAGNDEGGYRKLLERKILDFGVAHKVVMLGEISDSQKWDLYRRACLFVLPSISENFGNVVLEAMAMSCPVLVSTGVGLADVVRQARCGLVCDNHPEILAATITQMLQDPGLAEMGERGRALVKREYTWDAVAVAMDRAYASVLGGQGASGVVSA